MPVNAPAEYFKAEERFKSAKTREEKILALEEMVRLMPRHHGSEKALAQLKSRLAKLRKETSKGGGAHKEGLKKEGEAQICIIGLANSGKSWLLSRLTKAQPAPSRSCPGRSRSWSKSSRSPTCRASVRTWPGRSRKS